MLFIRDSCSVMLDVMKLKRVDWPFKRLIFFQIEIIWYSGADGKQLCRSLELNQSLFPLQTSRDGSVSPHAHHMPHICSVLLTELSWSGTADIRKATKSLFIDSQLWILLYVITCHKRFCPPAFKLSLLSASSWTFHGNVFHCITVLFYFPFWYMEIIFLDIVLQ